ncbi:hypothetical protein BG011_004502 [Mortierella polycephala]|uniref:Rho-GAP domain-containing protein n=1 Tax=Mortierella polycephala TaxID=41804 RepID=A0A9P6U2I5_9FUNG|nr:hypothetical protein BG011_004502 [Mortierella polycephala]
MLQDLQPGTVPKEYQTLYNQSMGIQSAPAHPAPLLNRRYSVDQLDNRPVSCTSTINFPPANASACAQSPKGIKSRTKAFSNFLKFKFEGRDSPGRSRSGPKSSRWASRGGIGSKNEMMVDLETAGIFVPAHGRRLRSDFVYRAIIQCVDEIRRRGLDHQNIFFNPSPKKVISAMISLMMDQERCELYTIHCLRIDTVASLMLNTLSQMSNPVIPYAVMEYYFKQGISVTRASHYSTSSRRYSMHPGTCSDGSLLSMYASLPAIPALPFLDHPGSRSTSQETLSWAREYFALQSFLDVLPSTNRVILLEILHLCKEILDHQIKNQLTFGRLVHQVAPALFSTVFDQRSVETMVGESRRCSIHGGSISAVDGRRAENHLFSIILIRFMFLTSSSSTTMSRTSVQEAGSHTNPHHRHSIAAMSMEELGRSGSGHDRNESMMFRMNQEHIQEEQQAYYRRMSRSFHEMEIQQCPQQHFGQYTANQRQAQTQARRQSSYHGELYS